MKKRLLSLALSFVMLLTMLPVSVWAEEDSSEEVVPVVLAEPAETVTETVSAPNSGPDNDELFMGYLYQLAGINPEKEHVTSSDPFSIRHEAMGTVAITGINQTVYDSLAAQVKLVAENGGSTVLFCPLTDMETYSYSEYAAWAGQNPIVLEGIGRSDEYYTNQYENLGKSMQEFVEDMALYTGYINDYGDAVATANDALNNDFSFPTVMNMLLANMPYDLYWYDKTEGASYRPNFNIVTDTEKDTVTIEYGVEVYFSVANSYWSGQSVVLTDDEGKEYTICVNVISNVTAASDAAQNARNVVATHSDKQDYEKLQSYLTYVDGQVSYNSYAANEDNNVPYGDPWQLIYVFDDDPNTNVVCEGYAKAFKFLCDLSTWSDPDFDCYLATGQMIGGTGEGPHMWNVVHIRDANNPNGASFLVDPTNCDEGMVGRDYGLFLRGNSTSENVERYNKNTGKYYNSLTYTFTFGNQSIIFGYDDDTQALYGIDELTLATQDYVEPAAQPRLMWCNNHYDWVGEECFTTHELWDEVNVSMGQVIEGQFVFGTDKAYETLDLQTLGYEGAAVLNPREEDTTDLALEAVAFGTMTVTYQHGNEAYTLPVTVGLPDVGFYSQPTASKENYLTEWRYDGSNTVYLVWPQGATDVTILPDEHSHTKATATKADGYGYATITITNLQEDDVAFEVSYQLSGNEVRTHVHLRVVDVRPGLGFYQARNGGSGYAREDGAALERSFGTMGKGRHREVQFVITGAEEAIVKLSNLVYDEEYIEVKDLGNDCVELAFNKFGDTELSVTVGGNTYTMPITIGLPDLGFYSSPEASTETYLNEWVYTGEDSVIYLVCQNGRLTKVTGAGDNASGVSATILDGGKAAEIQLTELPDAGHLDVRAEYTRYDDDVSDHGDASVGFLMPQLLVNLSLPEGVSDAEVILWDKAGTAALESQPEMRRIGNRAVFPHVVPDEYMVTVEHQGCATRTYDITVTQGQVTVVDAVVTALGDLNGSGKTEISDMACLYDWLYLGEYTGALKDDEAYFRAVADVNEDGLVNILDYQALYEIIKAAPPTE